jgi:hypothetical protein
LNAGFIILVVIKIVAIMLRLLIRGIEDEDNRNIEYNDDDQRSIEIYLLLLYERSPSRDPPFITREEIAKEMSISDTQRDNIVHKLFDRGYVTKNGIISSKIRITEKGREYVRDVILG